MQLYLFFHEFMFRVGSVFVKQKYIKIKPMASGKKGFAKNKKLKTLFRKYVFKFRVRESENMEIQNNENNNNNNSNKKIIRNVHAFFLSIFIKFRQLLKTKACFG